ncbi:MAG: hypothetical protein PHX85_04765, partial [Methanobacteriaceae archaeon]|nr:hypothetical protein [Methanobacteriaceae archaeon]
MNDIILKFAKKGINLSPDAYKKIISTEDPNDFSTSLILKLKTKNYSKNDFISLKGDIVNHYIKELGIKTKNENKKEINNLNSLDNFNKEQPKNNTITKEQPKNNTIT